MSVTSGQKLHTDELAAQSVKAIVFKYKAKQPRMKRRVSI